jgi:hypothetical protein
MLPLTHWPAEFWHTLKNAFAAGSFVGFLLTLLQFFQPYMSMLPGACGMLATCLVWLVIEILKRFNDGPKPAA